MKPGGNARRPVGERLQSRPPPSIDDASRPRNAVVLLGLRAGYVKRIRTESREGSDDLRPTQIAIPSRSPQSSQACVMAERSPAASSGIGLVPVIAVRAQNQW